VIKESRSCDCCGELKTKSQFFEWYQHPALAFLNNDLIGIVCTKCAKREMGSKSWKKYKENNNA